MRYAIVSDIHGNLEALQAVLADIQTRHIDEIFCLGDVVGYYPDPGRCIELVRVYQGHQNGLPLLQSYWLLMGMTAS